MISKEDRVGNIVVGAIVGKKGYSTARKTVQSQ